MKPRLLFVDDEETIRITLPAILRTEGFEVFVAATVSEALDAINRDKFDILLADLNIGQPGDGFTVVSAMRRTQPSVATFILTGYPDFQSALEAIRQQVDDYLTKPADIGTLVQTLKAKLLHPRNVGKHEPKRVARVIRERSENILQAWLSETQANEELNRVRMRDRERIDHLPWMLDALIRTLETGNSDLASAVQQTATKHGQNRKAHGYTIPMLVKEAGILHRVLSRTLQECLLEIDLSTLVADVMRIGEELNALLEQSIRAFEERGHQAA